jgi:hypothetical protein
MYSKIVNEYILDNDKIYEEYIYLFGILIYKYKEVIEIKEEEVNKQSIGFKLND